MKIRKLYPLLFLLLLVISSCKKENETSKTVVYEVAMQPSSSGSTFIVKGQYTNEKGESVTVDEEVPFKVTLNNVPEDVKCNFEGYLFCANTNVIKGSISMKVTSNGDVVFHKIKTLDLTNTGSYPADEQKTETRFLFTEE